MLSTVSNAQSTTQSAQATAVQQSLSQRVGILLKRAGVEVQGEGPMELSVDSNGNVVAGGNVENAEELTAALSGDTKLKNLMQASEMTASQESEVENETIAGVSKTQLAEIWSSIKNDPNGEAMLKQIVDKLQLLDDLGQKYTGELTAQAILAADNGQEYYQDLATSLKTNMPTIFDYLDETSSSGGGLASLIGNDSNSASSVSDLFSATNSYALAKAYSQTSLGSYATGSSGYTTSIDTDA